MGRHCRSTSLPARPWAATRWKSRAASRPIRWSSGWDRSHREAHPDRSGRSTQVQEVSHEAPSRSLFLSTLVALSASAYENDCNNPRRPDCSKCPSPCVASNPIDPASASLQRQVTDPETYGAAPIRFTRIYNSRTTDFTDRYWDFGNRQTWQHNWNFEVRQLSTKTFEQFDIKVRYPGGNESNFKAPDATSNQRIPDADNGDRLYKWAGTKVGYTLVTADGHEYDFWRYLSPKFRLTEMRDGHGLKWTFSYGTDAKFKRITNVFGRWMELERTAVNGVQSITRVYTSDGRQVTYGYSAWTPTGNVVLTTATYPGSEQAQYGWVTADPNSATARPVLESARDPMYRGAGGRTKYVYNYEASYPGSYGLVTGTIKEERNLDTDELIATLPGGGGQYPQILQGDGTEITRKFVNGFLVESRDGEGRATFYTYSSGGQGYLESMTAPNGAVTHYTRDYAGRVLTETNGLGYTRSFTYNTAGLVSTETDELNRSTVWTRDSDNRPTRKDYPDGSYEKWTYTQFGQPLTHRSRNGGSETYGYNPFGDVALHTDALGNATAYTYAASGLRASTVDARSNTTSYTYNPRGQILTLTHPDSTSVSYQYDASGNRTLVTDELGNSTNYTYDEYNRVKTVTDPLARTTSYAYGRLAGCTSCGGGGPADLVSRIVSPGGRVTESQYDRSGLRIAQTVGVGTPEAATTNFGYDAGKNLTTVMNPNGKVSNFGFDLLGRKTSATDAAGQRSEWTYDPVGNKTTEEQPDGGVTTFEFDARKRITKTTDSLGQITERTYDGGDNLLTIKDPRNNTYSNTYDLLNHPLSLKYPNNSVETYSYDAAGNIVTRTTRTGQVKTSAFDNRNRETGFTWSDGTPAVTKTYDAASHVLTLNNGASSLSYSFDAAGQMLSETQQIVNGGGPKVVTYSYDLDGDRVTLEYPSGGTMTYVHTPRRQISSITAGSAAPMAAYTYDLAGHRTTKTLENGTAALYANDDANRLVSLDHQSNGVSFAKYDYAYDTVNNRVSRTETAGATVAMDAYAYDALDQMTQVKYKYDAVAGTHERQVNYTYDSAGNRVSLTDNGVTTSYGTANPLNQYGSGSLGLPYDGNGNLTGQSGWTYTYDAQNRLTGAASSTFSMTLTYDARNRCVSRTVAGATTFLYYDTWNLIEEHDGSSVLQARYVHGAAVDELLARSTAPGTVYYHQDALSSTAALSDNSGTVTESYTYDVYGGPKIWDESGNQLSESADGNRFLFTGREWLPNVRLYDYRNRIYSPELGRFLQTDPIRFDAGDLNLYRYVSNNPANYTDGLGLYCVCDGEGNWEWHGDYGPVPASSNDYDYINNDMTTVVDDKCYDCNSDGSVVVDQDCIAEVRDCQLVQLFMNNELLPEDYPKPDHCGE